ncbi:MAG: prephenate dehydratase domain-containing protein [Candidatus Woesebacteria bacterium]|jgi:chorismate mutase/prephenate dehydratase
MDKLSELRDQIDKVNAQLIELLNTRATLAKMVGQVKGDAPKFAPAREAEVIKECQKSNKGPLPSKAIDAIMREVIGACLNLEQQLKVAYLGPDGTYSQIAAQKRFGAMTQYVPCKSIDLAIATVSRGLADVAVVPVENSIEGPVTRTLDLLYGAGLTVCGEVILPINHQLLANVDFAKITEVKSHPQSLAQCHLWLQNNLPNAKITPVASNAEAAKQASDKNSTCAAIASTQAGELYGLKVLAGNIADEQNNTTRFLMVGEGIDN